MLEIAGCRVIRSSYGGLFDSCLSYSFAKYAIVWRQARVKTKTNEKQTKNYEYNGLV